MSTESTATAPELSKTASAARPELNPLTRCLTYYGLWIIRRLRWLKRRLLAIAMLLYYLLRIAFRRVRRALLALAVRNGLDHTNASRRLHELREERRSACTAYGAPCG